MTNTQREGRAFLGGGSARSTVAGWLMEPDASKDGSISDVAATSSLSSVAASLQDKGPRSYYYWNSTTGDGANAPSKELPKRLAQEQIASPSTVRSIQDYAFLDDNDKVKLYIPLTGDLEKVRQCRSHTVLAQSCARTVGNGV